MKYHGSLQKLVQCQSISWPSCCNWAQGCRAFHL